MTEKQISSSCDGDEDDIPENKAEPAQIMNNRFNMILPNDFFELDPDPDYSKNFVDKFKINGNEVSKRCNCTEPEKIEATSDLAKANMKFQEKMHKSIR